MLLWLQLCRFLSRSALLLNSVMRAFRPEFVAARATDFIGMIKDCDEAGFPKVGWLEKQWRRWRSN